MQLKCPTSWPALTKGEPPMAKKRRKPFVRPPKSWGGSRNPKTKPSRKPVIRHRYKTWREAAGEREIAVQLESLPPGIDFPEGFPEPIAYDAARKVLVYRGFMSHTSYTFLRQLSIDPAYTAALDQIRETSCQHYGQKGNTASSRPRWLWLLAAVLLLGSLLAWWWLRSRG
jgi:hypothetical protein